MGQKASKLAAIALSLAVLSPAGLAMATPVGGTATVLQLPDATVPQAPVATAPQVYAPPAPAAPPAPSKTLPYTALAIAILALLLGLALGVIYLITERNRDASLDLIDDGQAQLDKFIRDLRGEVDQLKAEVSRLKARPSAPAPAPVPAPEPPHDDAPPAYPRVIQVSPDPVPQGDAEPRPQPKPQTRPTAQDVEDLLAAYREILVARDPEPLARFIETYAPRNVVATTDGVTESPDAESTLWLIAPPQWGDEGIVLPGDHAIRHWATTFQPSGGLRAEKLFGLFYAVDKGNVLEIDTPAWVRKAGAGQFTLKTRGHLRGA